MLLNTRSFKRGAYLLAVVLMLGACGKSETADSSAAESTAAETAVEETTAADAENESKETEKQEETEETSGEAEETTEAEETESSAEEKASEAGTKEAAKEETKKETEAATEAALLSEPAPETVPETTAPQNTGKSVKDIYGEITQKVALNSPMVVPDDFISNYYGIDVGSLEEYVFSMSEAAISAETVAILKAKDAGSTAGLSAALQTVIDQKKSERENYLPDQFQIVDKSSVKVNGNYVYLVISDQADAINQIIQAGIQ